MIPVISIAYYLFHRKLLTMQQFQAFFQLKEIQLSSLKNLPEKVTLADPDSNMTLSCEVALEKGQRLIFIMQTRPYSIGVNVKMEPVFAQCQNKQLSVQKLILHLDQKKLQLKSSNVFLTQLYEVLKPKVTHKGFNDYFKPLKRLGRGAFATVYLVESKATGKRFAAKVFAKQAQKLQYKGREALQKQIQNLKWLKHPNIIRFEGIYETDNLLYMVTEYLSGGTLVEFIRQNRQEMGEHILKIFNDILSVLEYLKENSVMHRDIKPENIVMRKEDGRWVLVDFGLAAFSNQTYLFDKCGTLGYMAPEVEEKYNPPKPYTEACDIYSLGVVCYELIMGCMPFKVENQNIYELKIKWEGLGKKQCNELPSEIVKFLKGLLETDPTKRWTPTQCKESSFMKDSKIIDEWNEHQKKLSNERYQNILKARPHN